jgi:hypothetical protein
VILAPLLIAQAILFPFVAYTISSNWAAATAELTLEETGSQMANTIQQLYLSLSRAEISPGTMVHNLAFPAEISGRTYSARGSLLWSSAYGSSRILVLNLTLQDLGVRSTARTSLGPNVVWNEQSVFDSSSPNASITVQRFVNGTILFSF